MHAKGINNLLVHPICVAAVAGSMEQLAAAALAASIFDFSFV